MTGFAAVALARWRSESVDPVGDRFKMVWVDALRYAAEMVDLQTVGNRSNADFVTQPVDVLGAAFETSLAVSADEASGPDPARSIDGDRPMINEYLFSNPLWKLL